MKISFAEFVMSNSAVKFCPKDFIPEYAFIGRSNVGKSSLINMLLGNKKMSKISGTPGKTQLINHFKVNKSWFLVDLPGYGYARASKSERKKFEKMICNYLQKREQLLNTFVLIDIRHEPQAIDIEFIDWMGHSSLAFSIVFTKSDKLTLEKSQRAVGKYFQAMREHWEELPPYVISSATKGTGRKEILDLIENINSSFAEWQKVR